MKLAAIVIGLCGLTSAYSFPRHRMNVHGRRSYGDDHESGHVDSYGNDYGEVSGDDAGSTTTCTDHPAEFTTASAIPVSGATGTPVDSRPFVSAPGNGVFPSKGLPTGGLEGDHPSNSPDRAVTVSVPGGNSPPLFTASAGAIQLPGTTGSTDSLQPIYSTPTSGVIPPKSAVPSGVPSGLLPPEGTVPSGTLEHAFPSGVPSGMIPPKGAVPSGTPEHAFPSHIPSGVTPPHGAVFTGTPGAIHSTFLGTGHPGGNGPVTTPVGSQTPFTSASAIHVGSSTTTPAGAFPHISAHPSGTPGANIPVYGSGNGGEEQGQGVAAVSASSPAAGQGNGSGNSGAVLTTTTTQVVIGTRTVTLNVPVTKAGNSYATPAPSSGSSSGSGSSTGSSPGSSGSSSGVGSSIGSGSGSSGSGSSPGSSTGSGSGVSGSGSGSGPGSSSGSGYGSAINSISGSDCLPHTVYVSSTVYVTITPGATHPAVSTQSAFPVATPNEGAIADEEEYDCPADDEIDEDDIGTSPVTTSVVTPTAHLAIKTSASVAPKDTPAMPYPAAGNGTTPHVPTGVPPMFSHSPHPSGFPTGLPHGTSFPAAGLPRPSSALVDVPAPPGTPVDTPVLPAAATPPVSTPVVDVPAATSTAAANKGTATGYGDYY